MAWREFNNNPVGRRVGDCAVRAISKALDTDWESAYILLVSNGFAMGDMPSTGNFILKGASGNSCCNQFAQYQVTFNGNIAIPTGGTVAPIAVAIAVNGEPRLTSRAIITPAAVEEYGNVTSTAIIKVPRCCCFSLSVDAVPASTDPTVTPAPVIEVQNANLTITRIA